MIVYNGFGIINKKKSTISKCNTLTILTNEQRNNNETYITLMQENIEFIKEKAYN